MSAGTTDLKIKQTTFRAKNITQYDFQTRSDPQGISSLKLTYALCVENKLQTYIDSEAFSKHSS